MGEDRVITLRFQERKAMDMVLYQRLEGEKKELGLSMPVYVKGILQQHFGDRERMGAGTDACMERIQELVHGELVSQSAVLAGTLEKIAERFAERIKSKAQAGESLESGEILPEYSDSFPEGFDGVLEKFM